MSKIRANSPIITQLQYQDSLISDLIKVVNEMTYAIDSHERMIEILMEMINEQRDTIQLIRYAFED